MCAYWWLGATTAIWWAVLNINDSAQRPLQLCTICGTLVHLGCWPANMHTSTPATTSFAAQVTTGVQTEATLPNKCAEEYSHPQLS